MVRGFIFPQNAVNRGYSNLTNTTFVWIQLNRAALAVSIPPSSLANAVGQFRMLRYSRRGALRSGPVFPIDPLIG